MADTAKVLILILTFFLGFGAAFGGCFGVAFYVFNNVSVNQMQTDFGIEVNTDEFFGEYPEVYVRDMTIAGFLNELEVFKSLGDEVTMNFLIDRYALIMNPTFDQMLSPSIKNMPLTKLFTQEGIEVIFSTRYVGDLCGYEMIPKTDTLEGEREVPDYWVSKETGEKITGINAVLANFNLYDIVWGNLDADSIISSLTFGEMLDYTKGADGRYYDASGKKITGVLAVVADCHLNEVQSKISTVCIGEIVGYEYNEELDWWVDENGEKVHTFMNAVSKKNVNSLSGLSDELTIADIIPEENRTSGYVSLLSPDTKLVNIADDVNSVFKERTMKDFVECGAITFDNDPDGAKKEKFVNSSFSDKTMDEMIGFIVNNLDALEMISTPRSE